MTTPENERQRQQKVRQSTSLTQARQDESAYPSHQAGIISRAPISTTTLTASDVLYLQRTVGNQAVLHLLTPARPETTNLIQREPEDDSTSQGSVLQYNAMNPTSDDITQNTLPEYEPFAPTDESDYEALPDYNAMNPTSDDFTQNTVPEYEPFAPAYDDSNYEALPDYESVKPALADVERVPPSPPQRREKEREDDPSHTHGLSNGLSRSRPTPTPSMGWKRYVGPSKQAKYGGLSLSKQYEGEHRDSLKFAMNRLFNTNSLEDAIQAKGQKRVVDVLAASGWSNKEIQKLFNRRSAKVKYLRTQNKREQFRLHIDGTITQGPKSEVWDTSAMAANGVGRANGIFVMDPNGNFYGAPHKIGRFHHSSFLAGGDVGAAGTMKVRMGKLLLLTNKTGHYKANLAQLHHTVTELNDRGINPSSYAVKAHSASGLKEMGTGQEFLNTLGN